MVFPVRYTCRQDNKADFSAKSKKHTFDFPSLLQWLEKNDRCPLCNRVIKIEDLEKNDEMENTIREIAGVIFRKIEMLLSKLPKKNFGLSNVSDFSNEQIVSAIADKIRKG